VRQLALPQVKTSQYDTGFENRHPLGCRFPQAEIRPDDDKNREATGHTAECRGWRVLNQQRRPVPIIGTIAPVGKNTSFSLDEHYRTFIDDEVASGRYRSASDVVRAALRLLEDRETQLRALREALIEGAHSGPSTPFDFDAFLARKRAGEPGGR
jgi:antitoxin ParD1/3/4